MCNVKCHLQTISIEEIEKFLKTRSGLKNITKISVNRIIELNPDFVIPDGFDMGTIFLGKLRRSIKIKKFYRENFIFLREIEALGNGWKINDDNFWEKNEDDYFFQLENPKYQITSKEKEDLNSILYFLKEIKKEGEKKGIISRIDEVIEELLQLERMFFLNPKENIFSKNNQEQYNVQSSCLKKFRILVEKKSSDFLKIDYLFLKQLISKAINITGQVLGTDSLAFDKALSELSRQVVKK